MTISSPGAYLFGLITGLLIWVLQRLYFPDLLSKRAQQREEKGKFREEERKYTREDAAIRGRLQASLINQCRAMQRVFVGGDLPPGYWKELHTELESLVKSDDAARALGTDYVKFTETLESDRWTMGYVAGLEPGKLQRAYVLQAVADVVKRFSILLEMVDDGQNASRYGRSADTASLQAELLFTERPPF